MIRFHRAGQIAVIGAAALTLMAADPAGAVRASVPFPHVAWHRLWRASLPFPNGLGGVAATSRSDIWAVGVLEQNGPAGYAVHWNGRRWHLAAAFPDPAFAPLRVGASSRDNVWVVGYFHGEPGTVAYRWDGTQWQKITLPPYADIQYPPVVLGPADVWVSGDSSWTAGQGWNSTIWHWNGLTWQSYSFDVGWGTWTGGVQGSSDQNLWVVGSNGPGPDGTGSMITYHWTGNAWAQASTSHVRAWGLPDLAVSPSGNVWVETGIIRRQRPHGIVVALHKRGDRWVPLPTASLGGDYNWGPAADGLNGIWFYADEYWTGRTFANVYAAPVFNAMAPIPGSHSTVWVTATGTGRHAEGAIYIALLR